MSEATRSTALAHAVAVHAGDGHEAVLSTAEKFANFIEGSATDKPAAKPAATKPAAATGKPATGKPAAKKAAPAESEEEVVTKATRKAAAAVEEEGEEGGDDGDDGEATQEQVETLIADLLGANLRKQAVALLAEYGAKSASGVKAGDRAAFLEQGSGLLLGS